MDRADRATSPTQQLNEIPTAEVAHEIKIRAARATVFDALTTKSGMQGWHTAHVDGDGSMGSTWHLEFPDAPSFDWQVTTSTTNECVEWECVAGPGDSVGTTVTFDLADTDDGRTLVRHTHAGWPDEEGNFRKCNTLWGVLMHHLKQYAETNTAQPAYS